MKLQLAKCRKDGGAALPHLRLYVSSMVIKLLALCPWAG